jgi:hypothetical protein
MHSDEVFRNFDGKSSASSPACFLHVPKSAGSSILTALEAALPPGSLAPRRFDASVFCDFDDIDLLRPEMRAKIAVGPREVQSLARYRAITGHFGLSTLLQVTDASSIATVLREPRTRLLSLYMYWRTPGLDDPWAPYSPSKHAKQPLFEFLSEPRVAPVVDNQVCRMLLHGDSRLPRQGFAAGHDAATIAADAIELLETLGFVGVVELGTGTWLGVGRLFGVTLAPVSVNVTGASIPLFAMGSEEALITADALDLLEKRNAADLLVYDHILARVGLDSAERRRVRDQAFANQLVKFGDLVGHSAARAAERGEVIETQRHELDERERLDTEQHKLTVRSLHEEVERREEELDEARRRLAAVHASASWQLTSPLREARHSMRCILPARGSSEVAARDRSLLIGWPIKQIVWLALIITSIIAVTDAIISNGIILIPLLATGPFCGLLTGRRSMTAAIGLWVLVLAVLLCVPDEIWDTRAQLIYLGIVAAAALLSSSVATLIERRQ